MNDSDESIKYIREAEVDGASFVFHTWKTSNRNSMTIDRDTFSKNKQLKEIVWWLMDCSFPDLQWARQRIFDDGSSDVCLDDGDEIHAFVAAEDAVHFLSEDEYVRVAYLLEDTSDYPDMPADFGEPPVWPDHERQSFFYYESY